MLDRRLLLLFPIFVVAAFGIPGDGWKQDAFTVSMWVDPIVPPSQYPARYEEVADANFNVIMGGFGASTLNESLAQINASAALNLKVIMNLGSTAVEDLPPPSTTLWGYRLYDEPSMSVFPTLKTTVDSIRQRFPSALPFINLLPNYASAAQLGTSNYTDYVVQFVRTVQPSVLCMDNYPMMHDDDSREAYASNLETLRIVSLIEGNGLPVWNFFNVMPFGPHVSPSSAQVSWQIFTSLTYGAKGVLYFCYWSPSGASSLTPQRRTHSDLFEKVDARYYDTFRSRDSSDGTFSYGGAVISPMANIANGSVEYLPTAQYWVAQEVNKAVLNFGKYLLPLQSSFVARIRPTDDPATVLTGSSLLKNITAGGNYVVGEFDQHAVMITNWDYSFVSWPTVTFDSHMLTHIKEVSPRTGLLIPLMDESPSVPGLQISVQPGWARFFILSSS